MVSRESVAAALRGPSANMRGLDAIKTRYRPFVCPLQNVLDEIPPRSKVYDIGCGSGALMYLALRLRDAALASGYDVSDSAIVASEAFSREVPNFVAELRRDGSLPALESYDVVVMIDVLHHLPRAIQGKFVREIIGKMRPGSKFILLDIDGGRRLRAMCNQLHDLVLAKQWVHPISAEQAREILLSVVDEVSAPVLYSTLWYGHYLVVAEIPASKHKESLS